MPQHNDMPSLVVVGELNADLIMESVNALPELSRERVAERMKLVLGSSSAILASNASALGVRVGFVGRAGVDSFGDFVVECLEGRMVDCRHVIRRTEEQTGLTVIYTYGDDRGMVTYPGAMALLTLDDIPWDYLRAARHLHVSSYYLQAGLRPRFSELFRRAKQVGLSTSFDVNWDPKEEWGADVLDVLDHVDVFLPNDDEARRIARESDLGRAVAQLARRAGTVIATRGADGVLAQQGETILTLPAIQVEPVDTIGAGDSFNAGFLSAYLNAEPLQRCLQIGLLTGAFSTQAAGGTAAFDDTAEFYEFQSAHDGHQG